MILLIAGGRDFTPQPHHWQWLDEFQRHQARFGDPAKEVVNGGALGADRFAAEWAKKNSIGVIWFPAEWSKYGNRAGPIRNGVMADYLLSANRRTGESVAVILFPGGRGTQNMHDQARSREITIYDWRERVE